MRTSRGSVSETLLLTILCRIDNITIGRHGHENAKSALWTRNGLRSRETLPAANSGQHPRQDYRLGEQSVVNPSASVIRSSWDGTKTGVATGTIHTAVHRHHGFYFDNRVSKVALMYAHDEGRGNRLGTL